MKTIRRNPLAPVPAGNESLTSLEEGSFKSITPIRSRTRATATWARVRPAIFPARDLGLGSVIRAVRRLPEMPIIFMLLLLICTPPRGFMQLRAPRFGRSACKTKSRRRIFPKALKFRSAADVEDRRTFSYIIPDSQHAMFRAYALASVTAASFSSKACPRGSVTKEGHPRRGSKLKSAK